MYKYTVTIVGKECSGQASTCCCMEAGRGEGGENTRIDLGPFLVSGSSNKKVTSHPVENSAELSSHWRRKMAARLVICSSIF